MQYSPNCAVPYVSMVDAGTVELIRGFGADVVSSANLIQLFEARWTDAQLDSHLEAGRRMESCGIGIRKDRRRIARRPKSHRIRDSAVPAGFICRNGMFTDHGPIVAVNANASDPHYEHTEGTANTEWRFCLDRHVGEARYSRQRLLRHHMDRVLRSRTTAGNGAGLRSCEWRTGSRGETRAESMSAKSQLCGFDVDDAARN